MFITILYMFVLMVFVSSVGGFIFYKLSYKFLFPGKLSYILGGLFSLLLGYSIALMFATLALFYALILVFLIYILFVEFSRKDSE